MLIKCPECGNDVSDLAAACPKCGCPVSAVVSSADGEIVKLKVDERVFTPFKPEMIVSVNDVQVWRGNTSQVAEIRLKEKTKVKVTINKIPVVTKNAFFEGEIDPAMGKSYILKPVRKTFNMLQLRPYPANL